jgi:hypothetical protein
VRIPLYLRQLVLAQAEVPASTRHFGENERGLLVHWAPVEGAAVTRIGIERLDVNMLAEKVPIADATLNLGTLAEGVLWQLAIADSVLIWVSCLELTGQGHLCYILWSRGIYEAPAKVDIVFDQVGIAAALEDIAAPALLGFRFRFRCRSSHACSWLLWLGLGNSFFRFLVVIHCLLIIDFLLAGLYLSLILHCDLLVSDDSRLGSWLGMGPFIDAKRHVISTSLLLGGGGYFESFAVVPGTGIKPSRWALLANHITVGTEFLDTLSASSSIWGDHRSRILFLVQLFSAESLLALGLLLNWILGNFAEIRTKLTAVGTEAGLLSLQHELVLR